MDQPCHYCHKAIPANAPILSADGHLFCRWQCAEDWLDEWEAAHPNRMSTVREAS